MSRKLFGAAQGLLLAAAAGCILSSDQAGTTVHGFVLLPPTNAPVPLARVSTNFGLLTTANDKGEFLFVVPDSVGTLVVNSLGFCRGGCAGVPAASDTVWAVNGSSARPRYVDHNIILSGFEPI